MAARLLADLVVLVHFAYLVFIPVGGFLGWRWRRVIPLHVTAVVVGLVSITIGFDCPLTNLELRLRERGGERRYVGGFIDHYLAGHLYPRGAGTVVQVLIAAAVVSAYGGLLMRHRGATRSLAAHG